MRKVIAVFLVLVLLMTMGLTLVACDLGKDPDPAPITPIDPGEKPVVPPVVPPVIPPDENIIYWTIDEVLKYLEQSIGGDKEVVSFKTDIDAIDVDGVKYDACLNGNLNVNSKEVELYMSIKDAATGVSVFGIIIDNGKLFLEIGKQKIHLENLDVAYLLDIAKQVFPVIPPLLSDLLNGLLGMTLDGLIEFIMPMLFSFPYTYKTGDMYDITFELTVYQFLNTIISLVKGLNLDSILAGAGIKLPGDLSINKILDMIVIPPFYINVSTTLKEVGYDPETYDPLFTNEKMGVSVTDAAGNNSLDVQAVVSMSHDKQDIGIPESLEGYEPFSITQMEFEVFLGADIKSLDVGELIAMFAGKEYLPPDTIILTADLGFTLKMQLDLNLKKDAENMLLIEVYNGKDTSNKSKRIAGIYFVDGRIKINVNEITPIYQGKNIEIILGTSLTGEGGLITGLLDMVKNLIDEAIKGFLPLPELMEEGTENTLSKAMAGGYNGGDLIYSMSQVGDTLETESSFLGFLNGLLTMLKMDGNIILTPEDGIKIVVDKHLFDVLKEFAPTMGDEFDKIAKMIGTINLSVKMENFNFLGIESIDLEWLQSDSIKISLSIMNMNFFFESKTIRDNIAEATEGQEYVSNVRDILFDLMKGVNINGELKIHIPEGKHDIIALINSLGIPSLKLPLEGGFLEIPAGGIDLNVRLALQFQIDRKNSANSMAKIELYLNEDVEHGDILFFKKGLLLGVYAHGDRVYLDLNGLNLYGFKLPKVSIQVDLMSMLAKEIEKLDINLILADLIPGLKPVSDSYGSGNSRGRSSGGSGDINDRIDVIVNEDTLKFKLTSIAIQNLLKSFDINLELPYITIDMEIKELSSMKLSLGVDLSKGNPLTLDLILNEMTLGKPMEIELPNFEEDKYLENLNDFVKNTINEALSGVALDFNLKLTAKGGVIPLGDILTKLGVVGMPNFDLSIGNGLPGSDIVLDCKLLLRFAYVPDNPSTEIDETLGSRLSIELWLKDGQTFMGIKPGKLLGVYGKDGKTYIDLSGFCIDDMSLPRLSVNIDIPKLLGGLMKDIKLDELIDPILKDAGLRTVGANSALDPEDYPILELNKQAIIIAVTSKAVAQLLSNFGLPLENLPEFDVRVEINAITGLVLQVKGINNGGVTDILGLDLSLTNVMIGGGVEIPLDDVNDENYHSSISQMLKDTVADILAGMQMKFKLKVEVDPMTLYLDELLSLFNIDFGEHMAVIDITEQMILDFEIAIRMQCDQDYPDNSCFAIEIFLKNDFFLQGNPTGKLAGIYGIGKETYIDLSGLKLDGAAFPKFKLDFDLMQLVLDELAKVNFDKEFDDAIGGLSTMADGDLDIDMPENPTIIINQDALALKITSEVLIELLQTFGAKFELPFDFDLSAEIDFGKDINGIKIVVVTRQGELTGEESEYNFSAMINIGDFKFGQKVISNPNDLLTEEERTTYKTTLKDAIKDAANSFLDGTTATAKFNLTLYKHKYNISEYLARFVDTSLLPNLILDITHDQVIELKLVFSFRSNGFLADAENTNKSRGMKLDLYLTGAPLFLVDLVADMSKPLISIVGDADGKTYLDLSNIILSAATSNGLTTGVRLPKIAIDIDLLTMIDTLLNSASKLDDMLGKITNPKPANVGEVSDENNDVTGRRFLVISMNDHRIELQITAEVIASVMGMLGLEIELPPITINGSLDTSDGSNTTPEGDKISNGLMLGVKVYDYGDTSLVKPPLFSLNIAFTDIRIGIKDGVAIKSWQEGEKEKYSATLTEGLAGALKNILNGTHIEAEIDLRIAAGRYNIADILKVFGINSNIIPVAIPDLVFSSDIVLHVKVTFIVESFNPDNPSGNRFLLKLTMMEDLIPYKVIGADGQEIQKAIIKAGTDLIQVFSIGDGKTYIDLSGVKLANITLPKLFIDLDVLDLLNTLINSQDLDKLIKDFVDGIGKEDNKDEVPPVDGGDDIVPQSSKDSPSVIDYPINVNIAKDAIRLTATSKALMIMFESLGIQLPLPEALSFNIDAVFKGIGVYEPNLGVDVNIDKIEGLNDIKWIDGKYLAKLHIGINTVNFNAGKKIDEQEYLELVETATAIKNETGDKLKFAIYDIVKTMDIEMGFDLNIAESKLNMTKLINSLLASSGQYINIPINLATDNITQQVKLQIKWNLDFKKHSLSEAYIMLYTESGLFEVKVIYKNNTLYIDLSQLGLIKFKISNFNLTALIDKMVCDLIPTLNIDITNIILNTLFPGNGLIDETGSQTGSKSNYMERVGQETMVQNAIATAVGDLDVFDILNKILGTLSIEDLIAKISLSEEDIEGILHSVGVGLGSPITAEGEINIPEGAVKLGLGINTSSINMSIKVNKIGGPKQYIDWLYYTEKFILRKENPGKTPVDELSKQKEPKALTNEFQDFGEYSLLSGSDLMMSILNSLKKSENPSMGAVGIQDLLVLNLEQKNVPLASWNNVDRQVKATIQRVTDNTRSVGGKYTARRGSIIITLYKELGLNRAIVYVTINPLDKNINILGTRELFNALNLVGGELVNINIWMDLAGTLGALFDPIIKMIPDGVYNGGITTTPTADEIVAADPNAIDIDSLFRDITLTMMNTGHIRVYADMNLTAINDMLVDILDNLFWTLDLGDLCGNVGASNIRYKDNLDSSSGFFDEFWNNLLIPLVDKQVGSAVGDIAPVIKSQIVDVISRLLPLARFDRGQVTMNLLGGKISDLQLVTQRKKPGQVYDDENLPEPNDAPAWDQEYLKLELYNIQASQEVEFTQPVYNEKAWQGQSNNVIYDPYNNETDLSTKFNTKARRYSPNTDKYGNTSDIVWRAVNNKGEVINLTQPNKANGANNDGFNNQFINNATLKDTCGKIDPKTGAYIYNLLGVTNFSDRVLGQDVYRSISVKLTILPKGEILGVQDIIIMEHGDLPKSVVANIRVDIGGMPVDTKRVIPASVIGGDRKNPYDAEEVIEKNINNPVAGPHVMINGVAHGLTVRYLSSKVSTYDRNIVIDAYNKDDFTATLPDRFYFAYESGVSSSARVEWDTAELSKLTPEEWMRGTAEGKPIKITAKVLDEKNFGSNDNDTRQTIEFDITIQSTIPIDLIFNNELIANSVTIDPYDIYEVTNSGAKYETLFPETAKVNYTDGHTDVQEIKWNNITPEWMKSVTTAEGGRYRGQVTAVNKNGDVQWRPIEIEENGEIKVVYRPMDVEVIVMRRMPKYIKFGVDGEGKDIKTLSINPYDVMLNGIETVMPSKVNVVYEQGDSREIGAIWDTGKIEITPSGGTFIVPVTIAPNTPLAKTLNIPVRVERMEIEKLALEDNTFIFDYAVDILYGGKKMADYAPKTIPVITTDGRRIEIPALIDFDNVPINIEGSDNAYAVARIGSGKYMREFNFRVIVPKPELIGMDSSLSEFWLDMDTIRELGIDAYPKMAKFVFRHYNGSTITKELPVSKWKLNEVTTILRKQINIEGVDYSYEVPGNGGDLIAEIADKNSANAQATKIKMHVVQKADSVKLKELTIDFNANPNATLPNTMLFSVTTVKINKKTSAKSPYVYDREIPVTWDTTEMNVLEGGYASCILYEGTQYEQRFSIVIKIANAPASANVKLASQTVKFSYQEYILSGVKALPKKLNWNTVDANNSILGTYGINVNWDYSTLVLDPDAVVDGVATFELPVSFERNDNTVNGAQTVQITNIPALKEVSKNMTLTDSEYNANRDKYFTGQFGMMIKNSNGESVEEKYNVQWNFTSLSNALFGNSELETPLTSVTSAVKVTINKGTPAELTYLINVTITDITVKK